MKRVFLLLLLACCLLIAPAAAAGGSGTAADPYIIETAAELQSMQNNLAAYYQLANDIDLSGVTWTPIGPSSAPFTGTLDGKGYTIKNLILTSTSQYVGLFGVVSSGTIKNINIMDFYVSNQGSVTSFLISDVVYSGSLFIVENVNVLNSALTTPGDYCGGIVGFVNNGNLQIINCNVDNCRLESSADLISGITGRVSNNADCFISDCSVKNTYVSGGYGGLISSGSYQSSLTISNCDTENCIIRGSYVGGLVGLCYGNGIININDCNQYNNVITSTFDNLVGGVIGNIINGDTSITNCNIYSSSIIGGGGIAGNIASAATSSITNCDIIDSSIISSTSTGGISSYAASNTITGCNVENTNIYAPTYYNIAPAGSYDSTSTASGITNVAGRYLYASGLTATPNGATVSYTLEGQQGSTTVEATQGTAQSWAWTFGDGATSSVAEDTTHTYAAPGTYSTSLTLKNYLDSTGVTVTTSGYNILPIPPTVSVSANVLQLGQSTTLSAVGTLFSTIQWQYSTDSGATWQDISGATTATYEWTPTAGVYQLRAHVTAVGTGFTADSNVLTVSVYAPPTINAVTVSPTIGQYTQTITLSAEVSDSGPAPTTYQWQQSPQNQNTWTNIPGATTAQWIGQLTFAGATDFRLIATGTGGQTISETVTYYIALPGEIQSLTATPSVITLPGSTTLTATGSNVISWEWQQYTNGVWTPIGYSASVTQRFTDAGTYQFRVLATGADGAVVTSETVEVIAGFAPSVSITSPNDGTRYQSGERIPLTATITGTDPTWEWSFGSQDVQTGGNSQTTWVEYRIDGRYTISIRVVSLFGTDEDSITIISGRESRPIATTPPIELESDGIFEATDSLTPNENGMPDITGFIMSMSKPFTDMIGAWFYFVLFAVPYLIIWIRQKNIIIPSILGVLFAAWVLIQLPAAALPAAIALITLSVTGGLYGIYVKLQNR